MKLQARLALIIVVFPVVSFQSLSAQYSVSWPTQPPTPMATDVEPGTQKLRIINVNDFLYTYDINIVEKGTPVQLELAPSGAAGNCTSAAVTKYVGDVNAAFAAYEKLFPDNPIPPKSLQTSVTEWSKNIQPTYGTGGVKLSSEKRAADAEVASLTGPQASMCQGAIDDAQPELDQLKTADEKLNNAPHALDVSFEAKNCKSEIVSIVEKYKGIPTGQQITVRFDVECDQITVGGGVLLTEIQNRSYTSSALPSQTGQFLAVNGTSRLHPTLLIALTSFNFPVEPLGHSLTKALGDLRLGISTGPAIQNSTSSVSTVGWFLGPTVSFLHRLYISPGEHFGEFADFPPGFTSLQQIPANFGALTPMKRWTARFAIGISIKGWDASKTFKGGADQPQTK